jgi:hypothetical protein
MNDWVSNAVRHVASKKCTHDFPRSSLWQLRNSYVRRHPALHDYMIHVCDIANMFKSVTWRRSNYRDYTTSILGATGGIKMIGETGVLGDNPPNYHFVPPLIPHDLIWDRTRVTVTNEIDTWASTSGQFLLNFPDIQVCPVLEYWFTLMVRRIEIASLNAPQI